MGDDIRNAGSRQVTSTDHQNTSEIRRTERISNNRGNEGGNVAPGGGQGMFFGFPSFQGAPPIININFQDQRSFNNMPPIFGQKEDNLREAEQIISNNAGGENENERPISVSEVTDTRQNEREFPVGTRRNNTIIEESKEEMKYDSPVHDTKHSEGEVELDTIPQTVASLKSRQEDINEIYGQQCLVPNPNYKDKKKKKWGTKSPMAFKISTKHSGSQKGKKKGVVKGIHIASTVIPKRKGNMQEIRGGGQRQSPASIYTISKNKPKELAIEECKVEDMRPMTSGVHRGSRPLSGRLNPKDKSSLLERRIFSQHKKQSIPSITPSITPFPLSLRPITSNAREGIIGVSNRHQRAVTMQTGQLLHSASMKEHDPHLSPLQHTPTKSVKQLPPPQKGTSPDIPHSIDNASARKGKQFSIRNLKGKKEIITSIHTGIQKVEVEERPGISNSEQRKRSKHKLPDSITVEESSYKAQNQGVKRADPNIDQRVESKGRDSPTSSSSSSSSHSESKALSLISQILSPPPPNPGGRERNKALRRPTRSSSSNILESKMLRVGRHQLHQSISGEKTSRSFSPQNPNPEHHEENYLQGREPIYSPENSENSDSASLDSATLDMEELERLEHTKSKKKSVMEEGIGNKGENYRISIRRATLLKGRENNRESNNNSPEDSRLFIRLPSQELGDSSMLNTQRLNKMRRNFSTSSSHLLDTQLAKTERVLDTSCGSRRSLLGNVSNLFTKSKLEASTPCYQEEESKYLEEMAYSRNLNPNQEFFDPIGEGNLDLPLLKDLLPILPYHQPEHLTHWYQSQFKENSLQFLDRGGGDQGTSHHQQLFAFLPRPSYSFLKSEQGSDSSMEGKEENMTEDMHWVADLTPIKALMERKNSSSTENNVQLFSIYKMNYLGFMHSLHSMEKEQEKGFQKRMEGIPSIYSGCSIFGERTRNIGAHEGEDVQNLSIQIHEELEAYGDTPDVLLKGKNPNTVMGPTPTSRGSVKRKIGARRTPTPDLGKSSGALGLNLGLNIRKRFYQKGSTMVQIDMQESDQLFHSSLSQKVIIQGKTYTIQEITKNNPPLRSKTILLSTPLCSRKPSDLVVKRSRSLEHSKHAMIETFPISLAINRNYSFRKDKRSKSCNIPSVIHEQLKEYENSESEADSANKSISSESKSGCKTELSSRSSLLEENISYLSLNHEKLIDYKIQFLEAYMENESVIAPKRALEGNHSKFVYICNDGFLCNAEEIKLDLLHQNLSKVSSLGEKNNISFFNIQMIGNSLTAQQLIGKHSPSMVAEFKQRLDDSYFGHLNKFLQLKTKEDKVFLFNPDATIFHPDIELLQLQREKTHQTYLLYTTEKILPELMTYFNTECLDTFTELVSSELFLGEIKTQNLCERKREKAQDLMEGLLIEGELLNANRKCLIDNIRISNPFIFHGDQVDEISSMENSDDRKLAPTLYRCLYRKQDIGEYKELLEEIVKSIREMQEKWLHGENNERGSINSSYLTEELMLSDDREADEGSSSSCFESESSKEESRDLEMPGKGYLAFALPSNNVSIRKRLWTKSFMLSTDSGRNLSLPQIKPQDRGWRTPSSSSFQITLKQNLALPLDSHANIAGESKQKGRVSARSSYSDTEQLLPPKSFSKALSNYTKEHSYPRSIQHTENSSTTQNMESTSKELGSSEAAKKSGHPDFQSISRLPSNETPTSQNSLTRIEPIKSGKSTYSSIKLLTPTPPNLLPIPSIRGIKRGEDTTTGYVKARSISTIYPAINVLSDPHARSSIKTDYGRHHSIREQLEHNAQEEPLNMNFPKNSVIMEEEILGNAAQPKSFLSKADISFIQEIHPLNRKQNESQTDTHRNLLDPPEPSPEFRRKSITSTNVDIFDQSSNNIFFSKQTYKTPRTKNTPEKIQESYDTENVSVDSGFENIPADKSKSLKNSPGEELTKGNFLRQITIRNHEACNPLNLQRIRSPMNIYEKLFESIKKNKTEKVHGLLKGCRNIQIDTYDKEGNTLLHMAVRSGNLQITEYLVEAGASINAQDKKGNTAAHYANGLNYPKILDYLLKNGVDESFTNNKGHTIWEGLTQSYGQT